MNIFSSNPHSLPFPTRGLWGGKWEGGLTLIEILVAVAIFSIVLTAIYSTFFLSHRAVEGMDESLLKLQETRTAIDILRREMDSVFYSADDDNTFLKIQDKDIHGKQTTKIVFTTFSNLMPGISKISYYVEDEDGKLIFFKKIESPYINKETEGVDIIEGIDSFSVEVKYEDNWVKTWDTDITKDIPDEIRISLSIMIKENRMIIFDISKPKVGNTV
ncbi:MAG: prepilin-type N-terminal cleavage/methylation domain-containing protein [Nitrospirota bacterium]